MARTASNAPKGKHLGATVSADLFKWFEDRQWDVRKKPSDLVREALDAYAAKNGYKPATPETSESAPKK